MTTTTLRRTKANVWGAGTGMPIIGVGITGGGFGPPPYSLEAWIYDSGGTYLYTASTVTLPSACVTIPALTRIAHLASGPWLLFCYSEGVLSGNLQHVFAWDVKGDVLYDTTIALPADAGETPSVTTPFVAPGLDTWIYYFLTYKVTGQVWKHLYKSPLIGGGSSLVTDDQHPTAGYTTKRSHAFDGTYCYTFYGLDSAVPYAWKWPLAGGAPPSKSPASTESHAPENANAPLYPAGSDATYDYWFSGGQWDDPSSGGVDGKQWLIKRNRGTDAWSAVAAFATAASYLAGHSTINKSGDVSGYFPWDGATGNVLKLGQPGGDSTADGNNGADPRVTLAPVSGQNPIYAHLCDLEHAWS